MGDTTCCIPADSRAVRDSRFLNPNSIKEEENKKVEALSKIAVKRGQTMSQMAVSWVLRNSVITSALIGASRPEQITENVAAVANTVFTEEELKIIDKILTDDKG